MNGAGYLLYGFISACLQSCANREMFREYQQLSAWISKRVSQVKSFWLRSLSVMFELPVSTYSLLMIADVQNQKKTERGTGNSNEALYDLWRFGDCVKFTVTYDSLAEKAELGRLCFTRMQLVSLPREKRTKRNRCNNFADLNHNWFPIG